MTSDSPGTAGGRAGRQAPGAMRPAPAGRPGGRLRWPLAALLIAALSLVVWLLLAKLGSWLLR